MPGLRSVLEASFPALRDLGERKGPPGAGSEQQDPELIKAKPEVDVAEEEVQLQPVSLRCKFGYNLSPAILEVGRGPWLIGVAEQAADARTSDKISALHGGAVDQENWWAKRILHEANQQAFQHQPLGKPKPEAPQER